MTEVSYCFCLFSNLFALYESSQCLKQSCPSIISSSSPLPCSASWDLRSQRLDSLLPISLKRLSNAKTSGTRSRYGLLKFSQSWSKRRRVPLDVTIPSLNINLDHYLGETHHRMQWTEPQEKQIPIFHGRDSQETS